MPAVAEAFGEPDTATEPDTDVGEPDTDTDTDTDVAVAVGEPDVDADGLSEPESGSERHADVERGPVGGID